MRDRGDRLVLTNGCFDILHVGHVRYLRAAREMGDALAVGLNDDESVRRLKGPRRPVNTAADRAEVLGALETVDYIVLFGEDTASELVRAVRPDVYVKGGDYSADPASPWFPPEGAIVEAYGGNVRTVPYVPGYSTTKLLRRGGPE
ncbi:MAG TPA: D-glycero-beta-D-manno-heptose 1-phosphate adenylyltransferase [Chloroflexota bacterium]|nr:D-glycero-beta-D-manno-heptose 1-phosphate adenylyltransferase [Chloroflexota bacterium]